MLSEEEQTNLRLTEQYLDMFNHPSTTIEDVKAYLDESIVWREMPNRFAPLGRTGDLPTILTSWEKGREYVPEQTYTLRRAVACGDSVALEIGWKGRVTKALPPFSAGTELSARIAIFLRFRDGKIVSQTDYPCYDPIAEADNK
ncbi:MAG TPA: nuclear transport factor 2 family protein [Pyrinomonadaceae bacterium]|jgi:ketosteroid isomerase-like protein